MFVKQFLIKNTDLVVGFQIPQVVQSRVSGYKSGDIHVDGIDDSVIGHTAFDIIIIFPDITTASAFDNEFKPILIILSKIRLLDSSRMVFLSRR